MTSDNIQLSYKQQSKTVSVSLLHLAFVSLIFDRAFNEA